MSSNFENTNFFDVLYSRKTIRKYTDEIPSKELIKKIADAGRLAPSATNTQNWEFIAIFDENTKQQMADAVENKFNEFQKIVSIEEDKNKLNGYKYYSMFFYKAPVVFVIVEKKRVSTMLSILERAGMSNEELSKYDNRSSILSMGAAIENMSLCAHALGLGTCWMCAPLVARKEFSNILGLNEGDKIAALLTVGYPDRNNTTKQPPKKNIDEVFRIVL